MKEHIGVSGCFGGGVTYPIDDIEEVETAVEEIVETATPGEDVPEPQTDNADSLALAQLVGQYARRVRLLTWAVMAIAIVLVLKEVK